MEKININQGYSNCSIVNISENSAIVTDKNIADKLRQNGINVLSFDYNPDIKLLKNGGGYSNLSGFIGGAISRLGNKVIVFGDLKKIDKNDQIATFIRSLNLEIIDFDGQVVIDYGGIVTF